MNDDDDCCSQGVCRNDSNNNAAAELRTISKGSIYEFFRHVRSLYAAALGENTGLYILGFNHIGIPIAYAMGYSLATFTTFVTILARYRYSPGNRIGSCCSVCTVCTSMTKQ
jgi:predicted membrane protein